MENVIITGGNGFIGSHIVRYFIEKDVKLKCMIRKDSSLDNIKDLDVEIVYGDINNLESLKKSFKNSSFVIHTAGMVKDWGPYKEFYNTNVKGVLNVLKASKENNIKDIIITSTNSVYGEEHSTIVKDEKFNHNSHYNYFLDDIFPCKMNYYRDTKTIGKEKALKYAKENNLNVTFIEPVWVYGEREFHSIFYEYIDSARKIPFLPGSKNNKLHVIYAGDLARAYYKAFEKKLSGVNSILIGNKNADYIDKIYSIFCSEADIKKPKNLPKCIIYPLGFVLEFIYTLLNLKNPPLLTRARANMFYDNIEYSIKLAEDILGFENEYSLEDGIKKTVKWYKDKELI